jgi:hypothetical protein
MKKTDLYKNAGLAVANQMKNSVQKQSINAKNKDKKGGKLNPLLTSLLKKPE